ncbi:MAG: glucose-6-phosphate isomerase [Campylobacterales bacterium]
MISDKIFFNSSLSLEEQKFIDAIYEKVVDERDSGEIGYFDLAYNNSELKKIEDFISTNPLIKNGTLKNLFVIGIGGSSLGTKAIDAMLQSSKNRKNINLRFLENVDPVVIQRELEDIELEETLFIVISKSGTTIETASNTKIVFERFNLLQSFDVKNHLCLITDEGSPLDRFGADYSLMRFYIPKNVGGRFSVLSAVGLLPLAIVGHDIQRLLEGARKIGDIFFSKNYTTIMKKAFFYYTNAESINMNVLFSYYTDMSFFNDWYTQLWAESLGKIDRRGKRVGLTPVGMVGSIDQHSFLQLIIEGPRDKSVTFIKVNDFGNDMQIPDISLKDMEKADYANGVKAETLIKAQCDATLETLVEIGVPVDLIEIERVEEFSVGGLIYYYEVLTSITGAMFGIDTYIQEGVELGKKKLVSKFS